jgi:hypothetical protein
MARPDGYRRIFLDTVGGTFAAGLVLSGLAAVLARYLALGHL